MAINQFQDLNSEDILSAHISGLQHAVNKVEQVLDMKTVEKTNHKLVAVTDQDDPTLHHVIYEGTSRNWLINPAPVIKRNGLVVPETEYDIQPAYGVVVFKNQQGAEYNITADFTQVIGESQTIDDINNRFNKFTTFATFQSPGTYATNSPMGNPQLLMTSVNAGIKNMDLFPFIVTQPTTYDRIGIPYASNIGGTATRMGLYNSNANDMPYQLLAQTALVANPTTEPAPGQFAFISGAIPEITLQPGVYWLARYADATINYYGIDVLQAYGLGNAFGDFPNASQFGGARAYGFYGYRVTATYTEGLPNEVPVLGSAADNLRYLERNGIANPWIRKKA
ncbi:hypothetical protein DHX103_02530 [Planococcus sp. X10-3]|uniref:hypothetical protein n=1 Tax=Planococcus sp. X10-3 TaxID=3061240 RepID=UPI003BB1CDAF